MKKYMAALLAVLTLLFCLTACQKDESGDSDTTTQQDIKVVDFNTTRPTQEHTTVKANKTVKINVPSALVESKAKGDIQKYAATYGYKITEEKDGSLTMKMDGITYSLMLSGIGMDVMMYLGEIVDSGDCPYAVKLQDYNEDFSYILMQVDPKEYENYKDETSYEDLAYLIGQSGLYYQYFTVEEENKCEVVLASSRTGKVVYREVYTD